MNRRQRVFAGVVIALLLLSGGTTLWMATCGLAGCPSAEQLRGYRPSEGSRVLDRRGAPLGRLSYVRRINVPHRAGATPRARGLHRGRGPPLLLSRRHRLAERGPRPGSELPVARGAGRLQHHHHAGGAQRLPSPSLPGALAPPQADRDRAGAAAGAGAAQAADSRAVPQRHLPRQRHLRRRGGEPRPVRQERGSAHRRRGRAAGRAGAGPLDLLAPGAIPIGREAAEVSCWRRWRARDS